jgi:hypothetical protein
VSDGACPPGQPYSEVFITPLADFRAERMFVIPAGKELVLYGPVALGGRLSAVFDAAVRVDGHFAVIETYLHDVEREQSEDAGGPIDAPRDIVVIDTSTLRSARFAGPTLGHSSLSATATTIAVDGHGCHVTTESEPIH